MGDGNLLNIRPGDKVLPCWWGCMEGTELEYEKMDAFTYVSEGNSDFSEDWVIGDILEDGRNSVDFVRINDRKQYSSIIYVAEDLRNDTRFRQKISFVWDDEIEFVFVPRDHEVLEQAQSVFDHIVSVRSAARTRLSHTPSFMMQRSEKRSRWGFDVDYVLRPVDQQGRPVALGLAVAGYVDGAPRCFLNEPEKDRGYNYPLPELRIEMGGILYKFDVLLTEGEVATVCSRTK